MKRIVLWSLALFSICLFSIQMKATEMETEGGSKKTSEYRKVSPFVSIELQGSPTVYYQQGKDVSVKVVGYADDVKNIETKVTGDCLAIRFKNHKLMSFSLGSVRHRDVKIYVTSPDLTGIQVTGSGDFIVSGLLDTDKMTVNLKGSGDIKIPSMICDHLITDVVGSGDVDIKEAKAQTVKIGLVGSGDVKMGLKKVKKTDVTVKGSGDVSLFFTDCQTANCSLQGSGDITLKGRLFSLKRQKNGSGDIDVSQLSVGQK